MGNSANRNNYSYLDDSIKNLILVRPIEFSSTGRSMPVVSLRNHTCEVIFGLPAGVLTQSVDRERYVVIPAMDIGGQTRDDSGEAEPMSHSCLSLAGLCAYPDINFLVGLASFFIFIQFLLYCYLQIRILGLPYS